MSGPAAGALTPKPLRQDAARNRHLLLEAARTVFGQDGLETAVEDVARTAGLGTGTIYRHFASKADLITALVEDLSDQVEISADTALLKKDGSGLWDFLYAAGEIQARNQGLLCRFWAGRARAAQVASIRAKISRLVNAAHKHKTLPASVGQPDVLLVLHGLRGVIEANYEDRPDAWQRYLELATIALKAGSKRK
ncbi:MAG TPA: helix-turn-helix domain-containing protein [Frankiaceae bacterium]|jgi:AcrR family transcriptional regulator|nr:helix-turn-helix domain-containing protein [Frankiaceae bacterium]